MYARKNTGGSPIMPYHEYPIAAATQISHGQVVKLSGGLVVLATAADTSTLLGVAAEDHGGSADALNERANGDRIYVYDAADTQFSCTAPTVTAASGSATTLVFTAGQYFANDDFNGGFVKLVSKASGSTNTDEIGTVRAITDYAVTANTSGTFTLTSGGTPASGDVYAVFPPAGFAKGNFDSTRSKLVLTASASIKMKVTGHEAEAGNILLTRV